MLPHFLPLRLRFSGEARAFSNRAFLKFFDLAAPGTSPVTDQSKLRELTVANEIESKLIYAEDTPPKIDHILMV